MSKTLCFDYDPILYTAGSVGETRSIKVVHRESGDDYDFATRTAFWGHWKKRAGGWLSEYNAGKAEHNKRSPDEFDISDIQEPEPIENCLHTMKQMIQGTKEAVGADVYYGYSGRGKVFREDVSTVLKYKGNRDGMLRPVHLDSLKEYLVKNHACRIVDDGIEADDACSIDCHDAWGKFELVLAYVDKDYLQCTGNLWNTNLCDGIDSYSGFGRLYLNDKGDVKGRGRLWLYQQVLDGDTADNYCANSGNPSVKWAEKSAYKLLKDCKDDKEAFEALVKGYKTIYPSSRKIIGWRGYEDPKDMKILKPDHKDFEIEIDWLSMLQENFTLAKMLRWRGDSVDVKKVLDQLKVEH